MPFFAYCVLSIYHSFGDAESEAIGRRKCGRNGTGGTSCLAALEADSLAKGSGLLMDKRFKVETAVM